MMLSLVLEAIMKISQEIEAIKWKLKHDPNIDEAQLQGEINKKGQWIDSIDELNKFTIFMLPTTKLLGHFLYQDIF